MTYTETLATIKTLTETKFNQPVGKLVDEMVDLVRECCDVNMLICREGDKAYIVTEPESDASFIVMIVVSPNCDTFIGVLKEYENASDAFDAAYAWFRSCANLE